MFGFGKKKAPPPSQEKRARTSGGRTKEDYKDDLAKLGLLGIGVDDFDIDNAGNDLDSEPDEADLEDELLAILGQDGGSTDMLLPEVKPKPTPVRQAPPPTIQYNSRSPEAVPPPETSSESIFKAPPPPSTIQEALDQRLAKYKSELDKATTANEGPSKVRRIGRIVKQYEDAVKDYKKGRPVAFDELPTPPGYGPIPSAGSSQPQLQQSPPAPDVPVPPPRQKLVEVSDFHKNETVDNEPGPPMISSDEPRRYPSQPQPEPEVTLENVQLNVVLGRQKQLKEAAVEAKRNGDIELAKEYLRASKGLDTMIQSLQGESSLEVDIPTLPTVESVFIRLSEMKAVRDEPVSSGGIQVEPIQTTAPLLQPEPPADPPADTNLESIFNAPPPPKTIAEALDQRLEKYKSEVQKANETSNSGKARRMGRIVKQYEEAIAAHKKGRPIAFDELPTPPGFGPIPTGAPPPSPATPAPASASVSGPSSSPAQPAAAASSAEAPGQAPRVSPGQGHTGSINRGANKPQTKLTLQEKQLQAILERQKKFKEAALNAKNRGDIDQAKEFLRTAKGFDKLVQASEAGLPVDMNTLPSPPEAVDALKLETSDDFEIVRAGDCIPPPEGSAAEVFSKLEHDLREQLKMCMTHREHFKNMGDVASGNRFEKMAVETKKDLDALRLCMKQNGELPKYHYENRIFSITECNSDLADDEIEISILKGINYKVPNPTDVDTFVKAELPYPSAEEAQMNKTGVIRDTNNPDYNMTFKMKINRTARPFHRFIHRHGVKLEVWSKGGFLRSSTLIGTATVKLLPLETKCTMHDAFDVLEGRRPVGKIEVKVRLREPVLTKQITQRKEKWLTIDRV